MAHVLISYKREDEVRVARLVKALQANGLEVWWDQALPAGEEWRENISEALETAGCVIVVWSHGSVGPEGGFVRDEAGHAKTRNILVPIRIDVVLPPLGFEELQAVDLRHWKGSPRDPFLRDLVAACRAKLAGKPVPPARGPAARLFRRASAGSAAGALVAALWIVATNTGGVQNKFCTIPGAQPWLSDTCGAMGVGGRPSHDERIAWDARPAGSCTALRAFIARYPDSPYRSKAADLLAAATSVQAANYSAAPRTVHGYVRQSEHAFASVQAAQADARARAQADATTLCAPLNTADRLAGVDAFTPEAYDCRPWFRGRPGLRAGLFGDLSHRDTGARGAVSGVGSFKSVRRVVRPQRVQHLLRRSASGGRPPQSGDTAQRRRPR